MTKTIHRMRKLTISEKEARGTRQKAYDPHPRSVEDIQNDIQEAADTLASVQLTARQAAESVKALGAVIPSGRGADSTHKPNPAIRIQAWALTTARGLKREIVLLRDEESLALQAQKPVDDEFAGLD